MNKNLDGVFFRIKRDGEWQNVCFCDLTITEKYTVMKSRSWHWYNEKQICIYDKIRLPLLSYEVSR